MAVVYLRWRRREGNVRRNRIFRDRDNPLDYLDDVEIIRKYRLSRPLIRTLCRMFQTDLQRPTMRSHAFAISLQVMVALRFYAIGSFFINSVSNITRDVTHCLNRVSNQYIKMPTDQVELNTNMQGFHNIADFPNDVGAIDGTHIRIKSPSDDEHLNVNRKNYHSVNVQGLCDASLKFLNVVARRNS